MKMHRLLLIASLLGTACAAEEESDTRSEGAPCTGQCLADQAIAVCSDFWSTVCGYLYRCYTATELDPLETQLGFTDETTCGWALGSSCNDTEIGQAVRDGRQRIDTGVAASCTATIDALACVPLADFFAHPGVAAASAAPPSTDTIAFTRSGWRSARRNAIEAPTEWATTTAGATPSVSSTDATRSACAVRV